MAEDKSFLIEQDQDQYQTASVTFRLPGALVRLWEYIEYMDTLAIS